MGSHAKNNGQQSSTPAATPTGVGGPTTTAKMTPYLQQHPVSTAAPGAGYIPGVSDAGPKLPGMAAGFDSHGMPIQQQQPVNANRNNLAMQILTGQRPSVGTQYAPNAENTRMDRLNAMMGSRGSRGGGASQGDRGGYTTSGSGWGGNSSTNSGYGMGGRRW